MGRNMSGYVYLLICLLKTTTQETIRRREWTQKPEFPHFPGDFCGGRCQWHCSGLTSLGKSLNLGKEGK